MRLQRLGHWPPPHPACVSAGPVLSGAVEAGAPPSTAVGGGQGPGDPGDQRRGKGWPGSVGPLACAWSRAAGAEDSRDGAGRRAWALRLSSASKIKAR